MSHLLISGYSGPYVQPVRVQDVRAPNRDLPYGETATKECLVCAASFRPRNHVQTTCSKQCSRHRKNRRL